MKVIKHSFDGVIVGAGGAGLRAAIEAAPHMKLAVIKTLSNKITYWCCPRWHECCSSKRRRR
jgi:aspartate oxidase